MARVVRARPPAAAPAPAVAARQEADEDVEDVGDAADDGLQDARDAVDDGPQAVAD